MENNKWNRLCLCCNMAYCTEHYPCHMSYIPEGKPRKSKWTNEVCIICQK